MSRPRARFWPIFAIGLFLLNMGVMATVITIAIRSTSAVVEPPQAAGSVE